MPLVGSNSVRTARIKKAFPSDSLDDLLRVAEEVRGVMGHPGWARIYRLIDEEILAVNDSMSGKPLDAHEDYAYRHGQLDGLNALRDMANAIVAHAEHEERIQRQNETSSRLGVVRSA